MWREVSSTARGRAVDEIVTAVMPGYPVDYNSSSVGEERSRRSSDSPPSPSWSCAG